MNTVLGEQTESVCDLAQTPAVLKLNEWTDSVTGLSGQPTPCRDPISSIHSKLDYNIARQA